MAGSALSATGREDPKIIAALAAFDFARSGNSGLDASPYWKAVEKLDPYEPLFAPELAYWAESRGRVAAGVNISDRALNAYPKDSSLEQCRLALLNSRNGWAGKIGKLRRQPGE